MNSVSGRSIALLRLWIKGSRFRDRRGEALGKSPPRGPGPSFPVRYKPAAWLRAEAMRPLSSPKEGKVSGRLLVRTCPAFFGIKSHDMVAQRGATRRPGARSGCPRRHHATGFFTQRDAAHVRGASAPVMFRIGAMSTASLRASNRLKDENLIEKWRRRSGPERARLKMIVVLWAISAILATAWWLWVL